MPNDRNALKSKAPKVGEVFLQTVGDITREMRAVDHQHAVDVELNFESVTVDERGFPFFSKHSQQSQMSIRLATRLTPPNRKLSD